MGTGRYEKGSGVATAGLASVMVVFRKFGVARWAGEFLLRKTGYVQYWMSVSESVVCGFEEDPWTGGGSLSYLPDSRWVDLSLNRDNTLRPTTGSPVYSCNLSVVVL